MKNLKKVQAGPGGRVDSTERCVGLKIDGPEFLSIDALKSDLLISLESIAVELSFALCLDCRFDRCISCAEKEGKRQVFVAASVRRLIVADASPPVDRR